MPRSIRGRLVLRLPRVISAGIALALIVTAVWLIKENRYYFYPKNFHVVEEGALYRGGCQTTPVLRHIIQKYGIRTVVNLDDQILDYDGAKGPGVDRCANEKAVANESGVRYSRFVWDGDGIGPFKENDRVADILASTASLPVFVHCGAGEKRTNAARAAFWIRHRRYSFEERVEHLKRVGV